MMMNRTETTAYNWLLAQGYENLKFSSRRTPDFVATNGQGFEVKKERNNTISFSDIQFGIISGNPDITVLIFNDSPCPIASIKGIELRKDFCLGFRIRVFHLAHVSDYPSTSGIRTLTIAEIAQELKVSKRTIFRWIKAGKLKAIKIAGTVRVEEEEYNRLIDK